MIKLGEVQELKVVETTKFGVFLASTEEVSSDDVLLPKNQVTPDIKIGDIIEVFIYKDSEDRLIATTRKPKIKLGELAKLKVIEINEIGAFLDWGLDKDLLLPFKEQSEEIIEGEYYLVSIYIDNSERLCATTKIYDTLQIDSPYKENEWVSGTIYNINENLGVFVAIDNKYHGLILNKELNRELFIGDTVDVRIKKIREDGKLELSLRDKAYAQIEIDSNLIMKKLDLNGGYIKINDKSQPELIKEQLGLSKSSFKRAVGRLLKEGAIEITEDGIKKAF